MNGFQYQYGDRPLEGYTIQRAVGRGGFGEVYFALSDSGREVALKAIQGYEQIELRGVSQCMNLKSPHLVTIFDVRHNDEGKPFVIMEYVSGPNLKDLIEQSPSGLGTQKAAFFLREIAKGLTYLHDRGIVHRDLKPGNIFYEDGYVKIGDYGLSKAMTASRYSGQTITVGTVHYMAPEIGQGCYDRGVDIYALGCCLYEMLTGSVPFFGSSHGEILMKHLMAEPDLTGIEEPFAGVIRKALAKEPKDRFQSAQEMVEAVFGSEHIRDSVSCFSPDSLTMVAGRVAEKVAVGGPGSSADAVHLGTPPPLPPPAGSGDPWQNFAQSMDRFGRHMGQVGERFGERMRQMGDRLGDRLAGRPPHPQAPPPANAPQPPPGELLDSGITAFADPRRDPLNRRQRRLLAALTVGATGIGGAMVGSIGASEAAWLFATLVTAGATCGLFIARRRFGHGVRLDSGLMPHIVYGGFACLLSFTFLQLARAVWFHGPGWHLDNDALMRTLWAVALALFFVDWRKRTAPGRKERVALGEAFAAGLGAWIINLFTGGAGLLAAAVLAGTSMAVQVGAPFDPQAFRQPKRKTRSHGANVANGLPDAGVPDVPSIQPATNHGRPSPGPRMYQHGRMVFPPPSAARPLHVTPAWLRALFLIVFMVLTGTGIMLLVWAGMADTSPTGNSIRYANGFGGTYYVPLYRTDPSEVAFAVASGCGCLMLSLFCLLRSLQRTYRGIWSAFVRPILMLLCAQAIVTSAVIMGNSPAPHLANDELMVGLAFIIFPGILFLVLLFIRDQTVRGLFAAADRTAAVRNRHAPNEISPRRWSVALGLACLGLIPAPLPLAGIHRLYVGKIGTGILWLFTGGLMGIGTIFDIMYIATGRFRDSDGRLLLSEPSTAGRPQPVPVPAGGYPASPAVGSLEQTASFPVGPDALADAPPMPPAPALQTPAPAGQAGGYWADVGADGLEWRDPHLTPRQTSGFWTLIGNMLTFFGFLLGLAVVLLPALTAGGLLGPDAIKQLNEALGYGSAGGPSGDWSHLLERLGPSLCGTLMLLGAVTLIFARRAAGVAHTFRALLGIILLGLFLFCLSGALGAVPWRPVVEQARTNHIGPAIEQVLNTVDLAPLITAGVFLLAAIFAFCWPERRLRIKDVSQDNQGVVLR